MVPKKRFVVKYTRQSAPENSSSDEGINPYLPPQAVKKLLKVSDRCWRLYRNLSYATPRMHANTCRTGQMAKFCPFID